MTRQTQYSTREYAREPSGLQPRINPEQQYLEMKFSDDSSVFSGLVEQENEMNHMNQLRSPVETQKPKGILRTSSLASPKYVVIAKETREGDELYSRSGSSLTDRSSDVMRENDRSSRSVMRQMSPMVDEEFNSGASTFSGDSLSRRDTGSNYDGDTHTTWADANDIPRPKGSVKLVSSVKFLGENVVQEEKNMDLHYVGKSGSGDSAGSRIVELLNDFERQMDANIQSLSEDDDVDEDNVLTDFNKNIVSDNFDIQSQEPQLGQFLTPHKAQKLQRILEKAQQDVQVLRDNNEQYRSEIEQMEEEHRSEIKLVEDRAKNKLVELKNMYQNEIDNLVQEKDAAVVEAGRVAAKYAENGKKQVSTLQKQIDKLKAAAAITIREKVKEERALGTMNKDKEIAQQIEMMQKSHQSELETLKKESEERLKLEVEKTASSVAKRVRLNQDVLISELTTQIDDFRKQRHSIIEVLESVKSKFTKQYPEEMIEFNGKSLDSSDHALESFEDSDSPKRGVEKNLMEVIEIFSYLLEGNEKKFALVKEKYVIQESKQESMKLTTMQYRDEIETLKRQIEEKDEKLNKIEEDFKALSQEKCLLTEKFQKESENQKLELERISAQTETISCIERRRKDLQHAMVEGQRKLEHVKVSIEDEQFATSSQAYLTLPSIETPNDNSAMVKLADLSPSTIESPSVEKARKFQRRHPNRFSRFAARDSPRNRLSGNFGLKQGRESMDSANEMQINIIDNPEASDVRSVISNTSLQSNGTLSIRRNQVREAEDQVIEIRNTMSDTSGISADKSARSKNSILSNFRNTQTSKEEITSPQIPKKEIEVKNESTDVLRRARMFKQFKEQNRLDDDSPRSGRLSLDASISSLQTNHGAIKKDLNILDPRQYKNTTVSYGDAEQIVQNTSHEESTSRERGKNTLGMFVKGKKQTESENDVEQESMMSSLVSEAESNDVSQSKSRRSLHSANMGRGQPFQYGEDESLREGPTHLNFKKPPLSLDGSSKSKDLSGKKDNVPTDVLSGKKADGPSPASYRPKSATRSDSIDSETENSIPSSIAVRPPASKNITAVANGHTLLCKPLSVHQSKIYPQETVSNLSGGTVSSTEASTDEDELVYESHAQMRKLNSLTDDSDGESGAGAEDKYESLGSKCSVDAFLGTEQKSVTFVDAKKSTIRRSGLAAFRPAKSFDDSLTNNTSETESATGSSSSDATTTVTGHTRKSISFLRAPTILRSPKRGKSSPAKYNYSSTGSKRFAALKARVRVRKV